MSDGIKNSGKPKVRDACARFGFVSATRITPPTCCLDVAARFPESG